VQGVPSLRSRLTPHEQQPNRPPHHARQNAPQAADTPSAASDAQCPKARYAVTVAVLSAQSR
jgi:hypothetical protein